ncbi:hypothetical protein H0H92_013918 [Tricholoma furcatifolium]|nr:hypothetical protein H0H92_013918 [Tricholoma furcatifolium]
MESHAPIAFDANLANPLDIPLASSELTELSEFNLISSDLATTPVSLTAHSTDLHYDFLDQSTVSSDATVPFGFYPGLGTSDESSTSTAGVASNLTDFNFDGFDFTYWNTITVPHDFSTSSLSFHGIPAPCEQSWTGNSANTEQVEVDEYGYPVLFLPPPAPSSSPAPSSPLTFPTPVIEDEMKKRARDEVNIRDILPEGLKRKKTKSLRVREMEV